MHTAHSTPAANRGPPTPPPPCRKLAAEGKGQVFMTDALLTTLMTAPRSVYPWDVVITRRGDQLFFDKRANSSLDFLTVREREGERVCFEGRGGGGEERLIAAYTTAQLALHELLPPCK